MTIATYKDLCIDAGNTETLGRFYAAALGLDFEPDGEAGTLKGADCGQRIWMNVVPEPKTVKHRVHLDVVCASVDDLIALGATRVEQPAPDLPWTVLADPDGGEFCAFVRQPADLPTYRMHELVIDSAQPREIAHWWAGIFGAKLDGREEKDWWWISEVPGMPYTSWDFVPVPEPKTVKNRVHWDVLVDSVDDLVAAGATLLRGPTDADVWSIMADPEDTSPIGPTSQEPGTSWFVMQDPEGNEFCAFERRSRQR